jgi:hypothetical protein
VYRLLGGLLRVQRWVARRNPGSVVGRYTSGDAASVPDDSMPLSRT